MIASTAVTRGCWPELAAKATIAGAAMFSTDGENSEVSPGFVLKSVTVAVMNWLVGSAETSSARAA